MTWRQVVRAVVGVALLLLGVLWALQGAAIVRIQPVVCLAQCRPVAGGSLLWFAIGVLALLGGLRVLAALRPRR